MLLICSINAFASCAQKPEVRTKEVPASVRCEGPPCISVTRAFLDEHTQLLVEVIRLKAKLANCQNSLQ